MSEAGYDGETCEGCERMLEHLGDGYNCIGRDTGEICQIFRPSLQCRQVRALERIADSLGRMDRIGITTWEGED